MRIGAGRRFLVVGHRGAAARAPENTAASLRAGIEAGADAVEIDVGLAADGRVVLLHDGKVDRTTNGRGPLARLSWRELERLDAGSWFSERFRGERLLDLDGALGLVRGRVGLVVEVKASSRHGSPSRADRLLLQEVLSAFERTGGIENGVQVSSSHWGILEEARALAPGLSLAVTVGRPSRADPVAFALRIRAAAIHPHWFLATGSLLARAHEAGVEVIPYTVNRARELFGLVELGADGVFTDDPGAIRRLLRNRFGEPAPPPPFALGIDQGSGGTRAVLVAADGSIVSSTAIPIEGRHLDEGGFVLDPEEVAASIGRAAEHVLSEAPGAVASMGLAAQRSSVLVWRKSNGKPLTAVLSWRAARESVPARWLSLDDEVRKRTGLTSLFPYGAIRLSSRAAEDPSLARWLGSRRAVVGPLGSFLAARLLGRRDGIVDPSLGQRLLLLDLRSRRWDDRLLELSGMDPSCLPKLVPSTADHGLARIGGRRLPLRALAGDVGAAARAVLGFKAEGGLLVLGTGGFLVVGTGRDPVSVPGLLTSILWEDAEGPRYGIEGTVHGLLQSLLEARRLAGLEGLDPVVVASRSGTARRIPDVVAAPEGVGTPHWDLGTRFEVEPGDWSAEELVRGTIASLASRFGRIAEILRAAGCLPPSFVATGGLATPHLARAISEAMGVPVALDRRWQTTALGAALLSR